MAGVHLPLYSAETTTPQGEPGPEGDRLMQIGDLARISGKSVRAIHLYEELALLKPTARSKGRFRLFDTSALVRIRWIGKLQDMGFSLTEIQAVVEEWEQLGSAPRAMVKMRGVYRRKLSETKATLARLRELEHELEASLAYLDTCDVCDPERLISACGSCEHHATADVPDLVAGFRVRTSLPPVDAVCTLSLPSPRATSDASPSPSKKEPRESWR